MNLLHRQDGRAKDRAASRRAQRSLRPRLAPPSLGAEGRFARGADHFLHQARLIDLAHLQFIRDGSIAQHRHLRGAALKFSETMGDHEDRNAGFRQRGDAIEVGLGLIAGKRRRHLVQNQKFQMWTNAVERDDYGDQGSFRSAQSPAGAAGSIARSNSPEHAAHIPLEPIPPDAARLRRIAAKLGDTFRDRKELINGAS